MNFFFCKNLCFNEKVVGEKRKKNVKQENFKEKKLCSEIVWFEMDLFATKKKFVGQKKFVVQRNYYFKDFSVMPKTFFGGKSFLVQIIFGKKIVGNRNLLGKPFFGEKFFFSKTCFFFW